VQIREGIRVALGSLAAYKMRTALTVLGNVVAVSSVIAVVSLISGMDVFVREEIADEGSNVLTLERVDALQILSDMDAFLESLHNPPITLDDYRALREDGLAAVERMAAFDRALGRVDAPNRSASGVTVQGWTADYPSFVQRELSQGRHFNEFEERNSRAVAVVGSEIAERIVRTENAVGKTIRINGRHVEIIGVLAEEKSVLGNNPNRVVLIPLGRHLKIFGGNGIQVRLLARGVESIDEAREEVRWWMRIRHGLRPADRDDFAVTSSERTVALWKSISGMIFQVLILLVSVSLVVGGVVIMNIMLVSVTERTREVGTRMALGARRFDILWQFLVESITLSMLGGLIGIVLGFGVASVVSWVTPLPYAVEPWAIVAGLAVTFVVGVFFGIYPANRAAQLDPVEALRRE